MFPVCAVDDDSSSRGGWDDSAGASDRERLTQRIDDATGEDDADLVSCVSDTDTVFRLHHEFSVYVGGRFTVG